SNGIGGSTAITYYPSVGNGGALPFAMQMVYQLDVTDGQGHTLTTLYDFEGGQYYGPERDFRGFNQVGVTLPSGKTITTYFHQGNDLVPVGYLDLPNANVPDGYMRGKPYRIEEYGPTSSIRTTITYHDDTDNTAPWFTPALSVSKTEASRTTQIDY